MNIKEYHIQTPAKVMKILPLWEASPPFKGYSTDNMKLIISVVATHLRKDDRGNVYCQLKMEYLRNMVRGAERYVFLLIEAGIIERLPGNYYAGVRSYRYRFTAAYKSKYVPGLIDKPKILLRIAKARTKQGREETRIYPRQKQQLKTLAVNYEQAVNLIKEQYPDDIEKYNYALGQITRIKNEPPYFVRDDSGFRIHTPLTNLEKFLRSEITINGQYLSGLDIGNSQLYFAIKFLLDPDSIKDFFPGQFPLIMLKCLRLSKQQDVVRFVLLVSKAEFYKFMEVEFLKVGLHIPVVDPIKVSKECKKIIFTMLFEENHLTSRAKKIFQKLFPNVDKAFSVLRMVNYTDFVNCLARLESYAVNNLIIERLNIEHPNMVAQQIYDNLVTSIITDDITTASKVMTEELTSFVGYPPVLKIENFRPTANFN